MLRKLLICAICLFVAAPFACTKSEDDLRPAQRAAGGLMPDNDPKFEAEYVADQSQVKLVAPRTVSYEPLDTFRGKAESAARSDDAASEAEPARPTARAAPAPRGTQSAPRSGGGGNFWSRVGMKALMGGGAAPPGPRSTSPGNPAPKGDEPTADDEAADEEEAAAEEEEPAEDEEADSDEEETEDEESEEEPKEKDSPDEEPKDTESDGR